MKLSEQKMYAPKQKRKSVEEKLRENAIRKIVLEKDLDAKISLCEKQLALEKDDPEFLFATGNFYAQKGFLELDEKKSFIALEKSCDFLKQASDYIKDEEQKKEVRSYFRKVCLRAAALSKKENFFKHADSELAATLYLAYFAEEHTVKDPFLGTAAHKFFNQYKDFITVTDQSLADLLPYLGYCVGKRAVLRIDAEQKKKVVNKEDIEKIVIEVNRLLLKPKSQEMFEKNPPELIPSFDLVYFGVALAVILTTETKIEEKVIEKILENVEKPLTLIHKYLLSSNTKNDSQKSVAESSLEENYSFDNMLMLRRWFEKRETSFIETERFKFFEDALKKNILEKPKQTKNVFEADFFKGLVTFLVDNYAIKARETSDPVGLYKQILSLDQAHYESRFYLARNAFQEKKYELAAREYEAIVYDVFRTISSREISEKQRSALLAADVLFSQGDFAAYMFALYSLKGGLDTFIQRGNFGSMFLHYKDWSKERTEGIDGYFLKTMQAFAKNTQSNSICELISELYDVRKKQKDIKTKEMRCAIFGYDPLEINIIEDKGIFSLIKEELHLLIEESDKKKKSNKKSSSKSYLRFFFKGRKNE